MSRVLVVSPHPDDEAIGCGGTLRHHVVCGDTVDVVFLTSGEAGDPKRTREETALIREREANCAARILGLSHVEFWREPDGALRATKRMVERVRATVVESRAEVVYITNDRDWHVDHRTAARIVHRALAGLPSAVSRPKVWMYEVWTPVQNVDEIVDISPHLDAKLAAIRAYASQCELMQYDEAALGLSRYRGVFYNWLGGDYAEVFTEMRPPRA